MSPRLAMSALVLLCLASLRAAHPDLGDQVLLPALQEVGKALSEAEAGNHAAVLKVPAPPPPPPGVPPTLPPRQSANLPLLCAIRHAGT
jgi:hypothetical protein